MQKVSHGLVLYVGLNHRTGGIRSANDVSELAQALRDHAQTLAPGAQSFAAVALSAAGEFTDAEQALEAIRSAFGDPHRSQKDPGDQWAEATPVPSLGLLVDMDRREVLLDREPVELTHREFELLQYFLTHPNKTIVREELLRDVWQPAGEAPSERTVDVHIWRLRSKLGRLSTVIRTIRGIGYQFFRHPEVTLVCRGDPTSMPQ